MNHRGLASGRFTLLASQLAGAVLISASLAAPTQAQTRSIWRDVAFSGGLSVEGYRGNLAAVTVPLVDSTESAAAAVGEFSGRGALWIMDHAERGLWLNFDAGLRQFAASGFEVRDYAPREWVGALSAHFWLASSFGQLMANARFRGRRVEDRPPIPLFIQPGYGSADGSLRLQFKEVRGVRFDARVGGEISDYSSLEFTPQLDLLDRKAADVGVGAEWEGTSAWTVRFFSGLEFAHYKRQGTFDVDDPFRRDRTVHAGARWSYNGTPFFTALGVEGIFNRSNSRRPEYNAVRLNLVSGVDLPWEISLNLYGTLTEKRYELETGFARLVPGEEADNASVLYLQLGRPLAINLDGSIRFGWTRAETDIGDSYFQRYGVAILLDYRP
jgi:hypothetical protein